MAIIEGGGGTMSDTAATVWELAEGFAIIAGVVARDLVYQPEAAKLLAIVRSMQARAENIGKGSLADELALIAPRLEAQAVRPG